MIGDAEPEASVLVVWSPPAGPPMADIEACGPRTVGRIVPTARMMNRARRVMLGYACPSGPGKSEMERLAVAGEINALAYPAPSAVRYVEYCALAVE